jgi:methylase of polypeptide subunit release factors
MSYRTIISNQLFKKLNGECIKGRKVLDVGTRSGENAIMMLRDIGAKSVSAIDIHHNEFPLETHGVEFKKTSLQDYHPTEKYDVVSVFLWNIPYLELNNFMESVKNVMDLNEGHLIIGINEDFYMYDQVVSVPNLLYKHGYIISCLQHDNGEINKYILYCKYSYSQRQIVK